MNEKRPTIEELEAILNSEPNGTVEISPNGEVWVKPRHATFTDEELILLRRYAASEYNRFYGYLGDGGTPDPEKEAHMRLWDGIYVKLGGESHYGPDEVRDGR